MSETVVREEDGVVYVRTRRATCLRRLTCCFFIVLSIFLFLFPCFIVTLLVEGEVVYSTGDRPGEEVRFFYLNEQDLRAFGLSTGDVALEEDDGRYCVKTQVRYLAWEGETDPVTYCECYTEVSEGTWEATEVRDAECRPLFEAE